MQRLTEKKKNEPPQNICWGESYGREVRKRRNEKRGVSGKEGYKRYNEASFIHLGIQLCSLQTSLPMCLIKTKNFVVLKLFMRPNKNRLEMLK